ncbi:MAG: sigma-54 dependent transcriptional regulator [Acidobacteria bacterium]|nr:sigma-54 dependent transcriptional regulator [Acidobacteriota bacterium]
MSTADIEPPSLTDETRSRLEEVAAWSAVSAAFGSLGRAFICADADFRIIHGSYVLDELFGDGAAARIEGRSLEEIFGRDLFGTSGTLRQALTAGERREGWRAQLSMADGEARLISLSAAPFPQNLRLACSLRVKYVVVLRPSEQDRDDVLGAPVTVGGLVARSPAMARIFTLVENLRHTEATVLITGESGTGKELLARLIHDQSPRRQGPFVAVNCGALPHELLEAEMFGHARGAFTGAVRDRIGRCEAASDGTLFLDEVGDLPLALQVKLLRVLQDGTFERLGENQTRTSRARVVTATHVDLSKSVREGRFREDLYYRLRVVPIEIPPLRRRREDIEPLAQVLLARVCARHGRALRFSPDALRVLLGHDWPGNVREMENALEYAVTVCQGQTIHPEDLPELTGDKPGTGVALASPPSPRVGSPDRGTGDYEHLRSVLDAHHWRRDEAARALGISRITLWRRMRRYGMLHEET